jgi:hypothetical protein
VSASTLALAPAAEPETDLCLYAQSGAEWDRAEIRGWWKGRLFVLIPDCFCDGGSLAELNRDDLMLKRYATHDGNDYFTPDGRDREDESIKATLAKGQIPEKRYVQYYDDFYNSKTRGTWKKVRVYNFNERWVFIDWNGDDAENAGNPLGIGWLLRRDLSTARGAMEHPGGVTFHDTAGMKAKAEKDKADEERRRYWEEREGRHTHINPEDAGILGLGINANTESKVLAAFRKLSKIRHPDVGGSASEFQRLCAAKDRALRDLKAAGWTR